YWKMWSDNLRARGVKKRTIAGYQRVIVDFGRFLRERHTSARSASVESSAQWIDTIRTRGWAPHTQAHAVFTIRSFYRWLRESGNIKHNLLEGLPAIRVQERLPRGLTVRDMSKLLRI